MEAWGPGSFPPPLVLIVNRDHSLLAREVASGGPAISWCKGKSSSLSPGQHSSCTIRIPIQPLPLWAAQEQGPHQFWVIFVPLQVAPCLAQESANHMQWRNVWMHRHPSYYALARSLWSWSSPWPMRQEGQSLIRVSFKADWTKISQQ